VSRDAAGYGWFIDPTPWTNTAFAQPVTPTEFESRGSSPAVGREDLLTVVMHELGHTLGLDDLVPSQAPYDLMAETLPTGVRRLPSAQDRAAPTPQLVPPQSVSGNASIWVNPTLPTESRKKPAAALLAPLVPSSNSALPVVAPVSLPAPVARVPGAGGAPLPSTTLGTMTGMPVAALALALNTGWLLEPAPGTETTFPLSVENDLAINLAHTLLSRPGWTNDPVLDVG
jgi:hypothetical protein